MPDVIATFRPLGFFAEWIISPNQGAGATSFRGPSVPGCEICSIGEHGEDPRRLRGGQAFITLRHEITVPGRA